MKKFSLWALQHKVVARILIVVCYLLLNLLGWIIGNILYSINIVLSPVFFYLITMVVIGAVLFYPIKKKSSYKNSYTRRKISDLLLITATSLFIIYSSNSLNVHQSINPLNNVFGVSVIRTNTSKTVNIDNTLAKKKRFNGSKKDYKKYVQSIVRAIRKKYKDSSRGEKTVLVFLLIVVALFMIFLISALACNIICSGAEALGYIVLIVGIAGVIFGLVKLIQRVKRGPPKKKNQ